MNVNNKLTLNIRNNRGRRQQNHHFLRAIRPTFDWRQTEILVLAVHVLVFGKFLCRINDNSSRANCIHAPRAKSNSVHRTFAIDSTANDSRKYTRELSHPSAIVRHLDAVCVSTKMENMDVNPMMMIRK